MTDQYDDDAPDMEAFDEEQPSAPRPAIEEIAAALSEQRDPAQSVIAYGLSGLSSDEALVIAPLWVSLEEGYRTSVAHALLEVGESNFELDYGGFARIALDDEDADVRVAAIELTWNDRTLEMMDLLITHALRDPSALVRAAALSALGAFILAGELDELPHSETMRAEDAAIAMLEKADESTDVRRRALEAISNSSRDMVAPAIRRAYRSGDPRMQVSALFAMGRSCDDEWSPQVLAALSHDDPEFRYEAARAAGELALDEAVQPLSKLVFDEDVDVRDTAIWSLGEIGGREALRILNTAMADARARRQPDLIEAVEDAIASANLNGGDLYMMRLE